ncbi:cadherin-like protein 26 [Megalops cyprinoides]|uniref:cadherin-like protein 26 n=1 Tax=Megalops cyprinoides TaxID=118141 RepID=UPI0018643364|nr:cadherin-like protein 26 [Megalops cyprinoides]
MKCYIIFLLLILSATVALGNKKKSRMDNREKRDLLRRAKRRWVLSTIELMEEDEGPFPKNATQLFNDRELDYALKYHISGEGVTEPPMGIFSINEENGMVYVHKKVDREVQSSFHIKFDVLDKVTNKIVDRQLAFDVEIKDINDNPPIFEKAEMTVDVNEDTEEGDLPVNLLARDADEENSVNSQITMSVISQEPASPKIGIKVVEGTRMSQLTLKGCFDYDKANKFKVLVRARDHGVPSHSSTATVFLNIKDSNNHPPVFTQNEYKTSVNEMAEDEVILRLTVMDKDTPNTPASRAKYKIIKGNEDGNYKIETDPKTNEGVLTVIKAKDYEETTLKNLTISVENEEPLFVCGSDNSKDPAGGVAPQTVNVAVTVIDVNDPPAFEKKIAVVYEKEETEPGDMLYTLKATDVESNGIRYEIASDPENWVTVDPKTGVVKALHKMDRESPRVNNSYYTVLIHAIDDGEPPATSTATLLVHLGDLNDNKPYLVTNSTHMCGNKAKSIEIKAKDDDVAPFGGPFAFSLRGEDKELKELKSRFKLDPDTGESATLVSLKDLPYGNYTIPLLIEDQQGKGAKEDLHLVVCDCENKDVCKSPKPKSSALGGAGIATLIAGLLMLLLLVLMGLLCVCGEQFHHKPLVLQDEGNQTLVKYNEEGGVSELKAEPVFVMTPTSSIAIADGLKQATIPLNQMPSDIRINDINGTLRSQGRSMGMTGQDMSMQTSSYRSVWNTRRNSSRSGAMTYNQSHSLMSDVHISDLIERRLYQQNEDQLEFPGCCPQVYMYEGIGSKCQSLDKLSQSSWGDTLDFLQDLGPRFNTLDGICHQAMEEKGIKL